jgi:phage terminase large subunit
LNAVAAAVSSELEWQFPAKMRFLFEPHRYKVMYGGRDGAKSHSVARALLIEGSRRPLRIGCFREVQKSIRDSVHKLLSDLIEEMGLSKFYRVLQSEIRGINGSEFLFSGLSSQTRDSIKSFEKLDIAWIEEAQSVSKMSWDILIPTIRAPGSEIWATFNPMMETDDTYQRFVVNTPPTAKVVHINFSDNPWRSQVLDEERERMERDKPDDYKHIYLGQCRPAVEGAIYYGEVSKLRSDNRLCNAPYDPMLKVHVVVDLGFNDFMSMILVQRLGSEIRVIRYIEDRLRDIPSYSQELRDLSLNWGKVYLPHDAKATTLAAASNPHGATAKAQFDKLLWETEMVPEVGIEQGIRKAREVFPRVYVDKTHASELLNRLGRYRRRVNSDGQGSTPVHDDESHGADGFRYLAIVADQLSNDTNSSADALAEYNAAFRRSA